MDIKGLNKAFEEFVSNHSQINQYKTGIEADIKADNLLYPMMWVEYGNPSIRTGVIVLNIRVFFLDKLLEDVSNLTDILSDTLHLANDFFAIYYENEYDFDFTLTGNGEGVPVTMNYDDGLAGYYFNFQVTFRNYRDETEVPQ